MKQFINLLGVLVAGYFGYTLEPQLRPQLTLPAAPVSPTPENVSQPSNPIAAEESPAEIPAEPVLAQPPATSTESEAPLVEESAPAEPAPEPAIEELPPEPAPSEASPEPSVEESPPEPPAAAPLTPSEDPVEAMKTSVRSGAIKEFTFDQVLKWEPTADEAVDGENHQIGLASYKAETVFGTKTIQAKAFIKDGVVQKWVWLKSGMEIK